MGLFSFYKSNKFFSLYPDGIFIISHEGKILDINPKGLKILNCEKKDVKGKFFSKFIEGGSVVLNNIVNSDKTVQVKSILDGGKEIYLELSASQKKKADKVYVAFREVTQKYQEKANLKEGYSEIESLVSDKNKFFANVSDDILTPITSIEGFAKALTEGLGGDLNERQQKYSQIILKNISDLNYGLGKILNYFKLESKLIRFEPRNFDAVNLITQEVKRGEELYEKKSLKINFEARPVMSRHCFQDPTIIQEIINDMLNLVWRKTDVGGIDIIVKNPDAELLEKVGLDREDEENMKKFIAIEFSDSAPVISSHELQEIYNPYAIEQTDKKSALGISFVYPTLLKYIEYVGGKMIVEPQKICGNKTTILFPTNY